MKLESCGCLLDLTFVLQTKNLNMFPISLLRVQYYEFLSVSRKFIHLCSHVEELTNRFMAHLPYCLEDLDEVSETRSYLKLSLKVHTISPSWKEAKE